MGGKSKKFSVLELSRMWGHTIQPGEGRGEGSGRMVDGEKADPGAGNLHSTVGMLLCLLEILHSNVSLICADCQTL